MEKLTNIMKNRRSILCTLLVASLTFNVTAQEQQEATKNEQILIEGLKQKINRHLKSYEKLTQQEGEQPPVSSFSISEPEKFDTGNFGIVVTKAAPGKILAVTPGSHAAIMGLKSGDTINKINGNAISEQNDWYNKLQNLPDETELTFNITRGGDNLEISGKLKAQIQPAWELSVGNANNMLNVIPNVSESEPTGCGRFVAGRSLSLIQLGEQMTQYTKGQGLPRIAFKLPPGRHQFRANHALSGSNYGAGTKKFERAKQIHHIIIEKNKSYRVEYTFNMKFELADGIHYYTGPLVMETVDEECEL